MILICGRVEIIDTVVGAAKGGDRGDADVGAVEIAVFGKGGFVANVALVVKIEKLF